jgi:uncharacterized DUF497 family protein
LGLRESKAHRTACDHSRERREEAVTIEPVEAVIQQGENEQRVLCLGRTRAGRLLTVLYTERRGKIRIVTAYEMTKEQQRLYFEGK